MDDIDQDWWKQLFDDVYLKTDARTVCDDVLTCREVDFIEGILKLEKPWPILDLCGGQGRHSLELCRRGYEDITVLDYSEYLIEHGKEKAREEGLSTIFVRGDGRHTGLPSDKYKVILVLASSFGYFIEEDQNEQMLRESFRLLMPGGILLLDIPNRTHVMENFNPQSWHEAEGDMVVCRDRRMEGEVIYCRELVVSKADGLIRDQMYCTRLYGSENIKNLLVSAGFSDVELQKDFTSHEKAGNHGLMTNRLIVIAHKR
jgi:D-alanine-D-alanine ligase